MRKPQIVVGSALLLVLAAVLVVFMQESESDDVLATPRADLPVDRPPVEAPSVAPEIAPAREEMVAVAETLAPGTLPPEYRKHLGGVIGRVVDTDSQPVAGLKVDALSVSIEEIFPQMDSMFGDVPIDFNEVKATTRTKEDGTFRFEDLEPRGIYILGLDLNGPRATIRFVDKAPNSGELVDLGDVMLDPFVVFTGRVVDERRSPVAGARVRASNLPSIVFQFGVQDLKPGFCVAFQEDFRGNEDWRVAQLPSWVFRLLDKFPLPQTTTNEDGTFRLEGVPTGSVTVLVDMQDFVPLAHGPVSSGNSGEKAIGDVVLSSGYEMIGTVVDGSDRPIAEAEVLAGPTQDIAPFALMVPVGRTDSEGRFHAKGLSDKEHSLAARTKTGVEWTLLRGQTPGYDEPKIVLGDTFQIEVTAVAEGGGAIPHPQVALQRKNELPLHPLLVPPISLKGRLSEREDGATVISDLAKGNYALLVRAPGYAATQVLVDLTQGSTRATATLVPEFTTEVKVVAKADGEPVYFATLGAFHKDAEREMRAIPLANQRTDKNGVAKLKGLKAGNYSLVVLHPGYAETMSELKIPRENPDTPFVIELPMGGSLRGRISENGQKPNPDRFIGVSPRRESFPRFNVTDENGEFHITHLAPGEYTVAVVRRFGNQGIGELAGSFQNYIPERFEQVTIEEGKETALEIDLKALDANAPKARLRGRVLINGSPAVSIGVGYNADMPADGGGNMPRNFMSRMKNTVTDQYGAFDFGEVFAGKGSIEVRQQGKASSFNFGRLSRVRIELAENETRDVPIELKVGSIRGRVVEERTGVPVPTAEVRLRSQAPKPSGEEKGRNQAFGDWNTDVRMEQASDKDGWFEFEMVPSGVYYVNVSRREYAAGVVRDIEVPVGGASSLVTVKLSTGVDVSGKVNVPAAGEEERRWVYLNFRGVDEGLGNQGASVDVKTMRFKVSNVIPGRYEVTCWAGGSQLKPIPLEVPSNGLDGVELNFEPEPPPDPQQLQKQIEDLKKQQKKAGSGS